MTSGAPIAEPVPMSAPPDAELRDGVPQALPAPLPRAGVTRRRAAAAVISVAWCAALAWLVLATSNPVTLNRRQILNADAVVTVQITDRAVGACRVVRQWRGTAAPDEIVVRGLAETAASGDGEWILPLQKTQGGYEVLPSARGGEARLVYPATPAVVRQLEELVGSEGGSF